MQNVTNAPAAAQAQPQTSKPRKPPVARNGVDTPAFFATLGAIKQQPELAKFVFRARNRWQTGTHSETTMMAFSGAGGEHDHKSSYSYGADHPAVFTAEDNAPTPVEFLLHALTSCLTAGIANIAAARGVTLSEVESTIEGDINMLGILGLSDEVRNGYEKLRISFRIKGDASDEKLAEIVEQSRRRSAVYDVLTNGCPVEITVAD